ncbi:MAG: hypothetical protein JNK57_08305 [Planctomycetaceae bacterium]|nr:hypothetical protein [Planctomycetaceae bacterium]
MRSMIGNDSDSGRVAEHQSESDRITSVRSDQGSGRKIGNWHGLLIIMLIQFAVAVPVFSVAFFCGGTHLQQACLAAGVIWPLVVVSYLPLMRWSASDSVIVPMYLAIMVRMFGTLATVLVVRQIAAPLAPSTWFAYISTLYLAGLVAETSVAVWHLHTLPGSFKSAGYSGQRRAV